jgi:hypothetical protein
MTLLTPVEQAYMNGTRQFTKAQQRYIRCRLKRKLRLVGEELASFGIPNDSCNAAAARLQRLDNNNNNKSLVAQPGRARFDNSVNNEIKSPRRDLNARPKVSASPLVISTTRARDYETFALPG